MEIETRLAVGTTQSATVKDRSRIPVVGHTITDEDVGALLGTKLQPINLARVVKLLTDPHSAHLRERHLHALQKVIKCYQAGFIMKDLVSVFKVLNVCADHLEEEPDYMEPMLEMLIICSYPFLKEKTSDETSYQQISVESVAQLGYLMRVPNPEVRAQVCKTIICFYCSKPPIRKIQKHQASTLDYNQKIVELSDVPETMVKSLALIEDQLMVKLGVLEVLQKLSHNSAKNCSGMLNAMAAYRLCSRLMDNDPTGQLLFRSVDILWNMLELGSKEEMANQLNNHDCIGQLHAAFIQQLTQGYSHYDRQLRNDLLVLATHIAVCCPNAPFVETGCAKQLALFASFQEVKSHNALVKHLKLLTNHEDFELKKLLLNILVVLSRDPAVLPILEEGRLLLALFSYVRANEKTSEPQQWTVAQFEELQLQAISALCTLCPRMVAEYMTCQGSTRLLLMLEWCIGPDKFVGQGNSFHGVGGRACKRAQMRHCLRLMRSMASTGQEVVLQDFADQGAINQLISILSGMQNDKKDVEAIDVEMQCDMLFTLSAICEHDMHRKELLGSSGVDVIVHYLKMKTSLITSGLGHHRLLLTAVDAVWCCVVGCYITEDYFLEKEGVFLLMDLLENCPRNMHNLILGCLLDLCENPKALPHINVWRGPEDVSGAHLLCDRWREEEKELGCKRDENGLLIDPEHPLTGALQEKQGVIPLPANCASPAIVDVSENMRAKIYATFAKIGFVDLPGLTTEDHITLTLIEHYMDFKVGEVWSEVISELDQENVRPTTPDREALEAISRTIDDRAQHVAQIQKELQDAQKQQDLLDEQEYYAEIRENHRQKEKAIHDFHDFVARTSSYTLLKAAKDRQELSIDASRVQNNYKLSDTFHSTDLPMVQTTTFSNRKVAVQSTPLELTGGPLAKYDPKSGTVRERSFITMIPPV